MAERASHAGEPPATIAEAIAASDVVLAPIVQSLSQELGQFRSGLTLPALLVEAVPRST